MSLVFFAAALSGVADEKATGAVSSEVKAAYEAYLSATEESARTMREAMNDYRRAPSDPDVRERYMSTLNETRRLTDEARSRFAEAFLGLDWEALDPGTDAALVRDGLAFSFEKLGDDPDRLVRGSEIYLERFEDSPAATRVLTRTLPFALLEAGRGDLAVERLRAAADRVVSGRMDVLLALGDVLACRGETEAAVAEYRRAAEVAEESRRRYVDVRLNLVGRPAPDIRSSEWIGGDPSPLSELRGRVVVVDFWATWCAPCRAVMPALSELHRERRDDGLTVMGVTRFYSNGYLPEGPDQMLTGGAGVNDMTEESYVGHLRAFRDATGMSYPFVVATQDDFRNYHVTGIPTLAVVDPEGQVALVTVGSGSEPLVRAAVEHLLNRPEPSAAP